MTDAEETRGQAIHRRYEALGIGFREWQRETGVAPSTMRKVFANDASTRPQTYAAIEAALDKLERRTNPEPPPKGESAGLIEIRAEGVYGIESIVVNGPVEDADEIRRQVVALIRDIRRDDK